jgi:cytochrome c551/c552
MGPLGRIARVALALTTPGVVLGWAGGAGAQAPGDAGRGRAVFEQKQCTRCHLPARQPGVGPSLEALKRRQGAFQLAGRLWNHAPAMFTALWQEQIGWPEISQAEMADLMAYLGADLGRDPTPDLYKGRVALLRKGCLKCHSLAGEGARVGPDLGTLGPSYRSAAAWASRMWAHTPRMAEVALARGVLYPRFQEDEMVNLIGLLRSLGR